MENNKISLTVDEAKQLYELFHNVEAADSHFKTCQSVSFRDHVRGVYKAPDVRNAYDALCQRIENVRKEE